MRAMHKALIVFAVLLAAQQAMAQVAVTGPQNAEMQPGEIQTLFIEAFNHGSEADHVHLEALGDMAFELPESTATIPPGGGHLFRIIVNAPQNAGIKRIEWAASSSNKTVANSSIVIKVSSMRAEIWSMIGVYGQELDIMNAAASASGDRELAGSIAMAKNELLSLPALYEKNDIELFNSRLREIDSLVGGRQTGSVTGLVAGRGWNDVSLLAFVLIFAAFSCFFVNRFILRKPKINSSGQDLGIVKGQIQSGEDWEAGKLLREGSGLEEAPKKAGRGRGG